MILYACAKTSPDPMADDSLTPKGAISSADLPKGDITGFVKLHDEFGTPKADNAGMIVSLEGLQTAFPARTRPEGRFTITNAPAGLYNLSYRKEEFGNTKLIGIIHTGGSVPTTAPPINIWETPRTIPANLTVSINKLTISLTGIATPVQPAGTAPEQQRRVRVFFGRDDKVNALNYTMTLPQFTLAPGGTGAFSLNFLADDLLSFKPGERVYAIVYGITATENAYVDPETKRTIYAGINPTPSNVVSFVLP
ncbi:hypothetical protein AWR27_06305 [Spirosoma montaniterrae]|uniref:Uncharacterized protein n=2 Tax=Spirosoma montaniterrae TaxID=1178516 RepID=A0A1P9WUC1_9BACT|nr:hypothetical protein AWR27_06305 [Spirosoma montaniterrae]